MTAYVFHNRVKLDGFDFKDAQFTMNMPSTITSTVLAAAATALVCTIDTSASTKVKLTSSGDEITGIIMTVEDRVAAEAQTVGTVSFDFAELLTIDPAATGGAIPVVGSRLIGGAAGTVRAAAGSEAFYAKAPRVWEVRGNYVVAVRH